MTKRIITISREFGSGGRFIGEEVAKKVSWGHLWKKPTLSTVLRYGFAMNVPIMQYEMC